MRGKCSDGIGGRGRRRVAVRAEGLDARLLFAAPALALVPDVTLLSGAPLQIPLDGSDADGDALSYSVSTTQPQLTATFTNSTNRSLKISVSHASSGPVTDPAFSGDMLISLFEDRAPKTAARIIALANAGFYNGLSFHRVYPNFVIQGGDPLGNGTGGSGVNFDDEFDPNLQFTGTGLLAMAKSFDDTNDSQFFITEGSQRHLDFNHTIFGQLVEGEAIREKIGNVAADAATAKPASPVTMTAVSVVANTQNRVLSLSVPAGYSGSASVTVTVSDGKGGTASRTFAVAITPDTNNNLPILGPVADISTAANTPVSFQLTSTDVEGSPVAYMNWDDLNYYYGNGARYLPPDATGSGNIDVAVNLGTGAVTVTPRNRVAGVFPIYLGATYNNSPGYQAGFDSQVVPLFVTPAAPLSIDLMDAYDTGPNPADNVTRLTNANAANKMEFEVGGVVAGAEVKLFEGAKLLGQATVAAGATTVTITTNGSQALASGTHNLSATQTLNNLAWTVGNQSGVKTLASPTSATLLTVTVDTTVPTQVGAAVMTWNGAAGPAVTYTFNEDVSASLAAGDLMLLNRDTNQTVPAGSIAVSYAAGTKQATFTFAGVPDGNYRATRAAGGITDLAGNAVAAGSALDFFVMAGDADHNKTVDFNDLVPLAQNYNTSGKTFADGDFNYDGAVDFNDLVLLAQRYNTTLGAPAVPGAAALSFDDAWAAATSAAVVTGPVATSDVKKKAKPEAVFSARAVAKPVAAKAAPATRPKPRR